MESIDLLNLMSKLVKQSIIETYLLPEGVSMGLNDGSIYVGKKRKEATSRQRDDFGEIDTNIETPVK